MPHLTLSHEVPNGSNSCANNALTILSGMLIAQVCYVMMQKPRGIREIALVWCVVRPDMARRCTAPLIACGKCRYTSLGQGSITGIPIQHGNTLRPKRYRAL